MKEPTQRAKERVQQSTSGTFHRITDKEIELAKKMHEMWEDYTDDVEENAMRLTMYRDEAVLEALENAYTRCRALAIREGAITSSYHADMLRSAILGEEL